MRVKVDPVACARTGYCAKIAPEVFELRQYGSAQVVHEDAPPELAELIFEAEELCPTKAIEVQP